MHIICLYLNWLFELCLFVIFQFVYTHITLFVTHSHSEVVADEVVAETLQLALVYYNQLFLENSTITQSISRIAPNYHPLIGPICT
jgi:hypothetical protein